MNTQKHLFISDIHIPDHNKTILDLIYAFILDFEPDHLHIVGDFVNFTDASHYISLDTHASLEEELQEARTILMELVRRVRMKKKYADITFYEGNHENRLQRFLASNAKQLRDITVGGEAVMSLHHLLGFKDLGVEFVRYGDEKVIAGGVIVEHGDIVRKNAGYSAKAMLESRRNSGISGHTHRSGLVQQRYRDGIKFWIELGCLCDLNPTYAKNPDWQNSFSVGYSIDGTFYPHLIPIYNDSFVFNGKLYSPNGT